MVHTRLHHRDKLKIHRKMHLVCVSISMLQKAVELNIQALSGLLRCAGGDEPRPSFINVAEGAAASASSSSGGAGAVSTAALLRLLDGQITDEHLPYLMDLADAYKVPGCVSVCLYAFIP